MPADKPKSTLKRCSSYSFNNNKFKINSHDLLKDINFRLYGQKTEPQSYSVTKKPPISQPVLNKDKGDVVEISKFHPNFSKSNVNFKNVRSNSFSKPQFSKSDYNLIEPVKKRHNLSTLSQNNLTSNTPSSSARPSSSYCTSSYKVSNTMAGSNNYQTYNVLKRLNLSSRPTSRQERPRSRIELARKNSLTDFGLTKKTSTFLATVSNEKLEAIDPIYKIASEQYPSYKSAFSKSNENNSSRSEFLRKPRSPSEQKKSFNNVVEKAKQDSDSTSKSTIPDSSSSTLSKISYLSLKKSSQGLTKDERPVTSISNFPCQLETEESANEDIIDFTDSLHDMTICEEFFDDDDAMLDNIEDDVVEEDDLSQLVSFEQTPSDDIIEQPNVITSLFLGGADVIRFVKHNEKVIQFPTHIKKHLKWKMVSATPHVVKNTLTRSGFKITKSQ